MLAAVKNYFAITKKEWNGMLVLAVIIVVVLLAPDLINLFKTPVQVDFSRIKEAQQVLAAAAKKPIYETDKYSYKDRNHTIFSTGKTRPTYFSFNPNQLPEAAWKKLGLSERQVKVIKNYESKGGKFYKKEDLQKIYSVTAEDYARLAPYIDIPERKYAANLTSKSSVFKSKPLVMVEINQADSARLTEIKGIGPAFASRILKYRSRLGGFYKKTQLLEVYGLDSAKYEEISKQVEIDAASVIKININTCDFDDLKPNPYLTFKQINALIQYRKQHGKFKSSSDLKNIAVLNEAVIQKIEPYLTY